MKDTQGGVRKGMRKQEREREKQRWHLDEIWHSSPEAHVVCCNLQCCHAGVGYEQFFCLATFTGTWKGKV